MKQYVAPLAISWLVGVGMALYAFQQNRPIPPPISAQSAIALHGPDGESIRLAVEIADEPEERRIGLMHRSSLEEGTGMLFLFDEPQALSFWMKETLIPLDILFFDERGIFVSRATMQPCDSDPCPTFQPEYPASAALEVNADDPAVRGVGRGWRILY